MIASSPRYLRVEFEAANAFPASVDDAEFYFTPGDALVQFRCARRDGPTDFGASRRRMDSIRIALKFESVRVQQAKATDSSREGGALLVVVHGYRKSSGCFRPTCPASPRQTLGRRRSVLICALARHPRIESTERESP